MMAPQRLDFEEPARLRDGADPLLRAALDEARADLPAPARLQAALAVVPAGKGAAVATGLALKTKVLLIGLATVSATATVNWAVNRAPSDKPVPHTSEAAPAIIPAAAPPVTPPTPSVQKPKAAPAPRSKPAQASRPVSIAELREEARLLESARARVTSSPAQALDLVTEHQRRFRHGVLTQEADVLRIEALVGALRLAEARAHANAFARRYPQSAHLRRVQVLVGERP